MDGERQYHAGLDGLRFVAVAMVLVFHGDLGWYPGGFLGVSVFFTLSGFLITGLLLAEIGAVGSGRGVSLRRFWGRRMRRLAPASLACLAVIAIIGPRIAGPSGADEVRGDVLAGLGYVANWRFVLAQQSYADLFQAPSPVLHFWSLAIEEQFYVLFPLLVAGLAWLGWRRRGVGAVLAVLAIGSTLLAIAISDRDRVYYGTDTRAAELLIGGVLACAAGAWLRRQRARTGTTRVVSVAGVVALIAILVLGATTDQRDGWLYAGGFSAFALLSALVVGAAVVPGPARWVLSRRPFVATGRISYGVYLFHWPIFVWLTPAVLGFGGLPRFAVLVTLTLVVATVSHRYLEMPVRERRFPSAPPVALAAFGSAVAVVAIAALVVPRPTGVDTALALGDGESGPVLLSATGSAADGAAASPAAASTAVPTTTAPPVPATVLVLGSDPSLAPAVSAGLPAPGPGEPAITVVDRSQPACPIYRSVEVTSFGGPQPADCPDFRTSWVQAVAEVRPDAVLVGIGLLERLPYRLNATTGWDRSGPGSLREPEITEALDVLDELDPPAFVHDAGPPDDRVGVTLALAVAAHPSVGRPDAAALPAAVASAARGHQDHQVARPPRLLVVGDSTSRNVAMGLAAGADGRLEVVAAGVVGCPLVRTTAVRVAAGEDRTTEYCPAWDEQWPTWFEAYEPDAVLVVAGTAEQWSQQYPGQDGWYAPGSPEWVAWHDSELSGMVGAVADRGLPILVLDSPAIDAGPDGYGDEPEAVAAWNAELARWDATWAPVRVVPYAQHWADPRSDAGRRERPDGVHPAADVMEQLARTSLVADLLGARDAAEADMRAAGCLRDQPRRFDLDRCRVRG